MEYLDKEGLIKVWDKTVKQIGRKANKVHKHTTEDIDGLQDYATEEYIANAITQMKSEIIAELKEYINELMAEIEGNNLITFTIGGIQYQAEEGMTWGEWIEREYNTDGYYTDQWNKVLSYNGQKEVQLTGSSVYTDEKISNIEYDLSMTGSGA